MTTDYAPTHAEALATLRVDGAAITFTLDNPGAENESGTFTGGTSASVSGYATEDDTGSDPAEYARLNLTESEAPRLLFVASTFGDEPAMGASCTWGGDKYTVRSVDPYRPAGVAIYSYVIVSR